MNRILYKNLKPEICVIYLKLIASLTLTPFNHQPSSIDFDAEV